MWVFRSILILIIIAVIACFLKAGSFLISGLVSAIIPKIKPKGDIMKLKTKAKVHKVFFAINILIFLRDINLSKSNKQ